MNTGAAFNLFNDNAFLLGILSLGVSASLISYIWNIAFFPIWKGFAIGFLIGGSIGNGLDRWLIGSVTDFIQLIPISFPIFNVADIAINIAVLCFLMNTITNYNDHKHT